MAKEGEEGIGRESCARAAKGGMRGGDDGAKKERRGEKGARVERATEAGERGESIQRRDKVKGEHRTERRSGEEAREKGGHAVQPVARLRRRGEVEVVGGGLGEGTGGVPRRLPPALLLLLLALLLRKVLLLLLRHHRLLLLRLVLRQQVRRDLLLLLSRALRLHEALLRGRGRARAVRLLLLLLRVPADAGAVVRLLRLLLLRRGRLLLRRGSGRSRCGCGLALLRRLHAVSADARGAALLPLGRDRLRLLDLVLGPRRDVQAAVNDGRDGLDLGAELLLDPVQVEPVVERDEVDGEAQVAVPSRAADAVQVRLCVLGEVKVDDDVDGLDVDAARQEVRAHEVAAHAVAEVVEDAVAVRLEHARVRVEARVAQLGDLLGEELDPVGRVAEDDRLVDLQL